MLRNTVELIINKYLLPIITIRLQNNKQHKFRSSNHSTTGKEIERTQRNDDDRPDAESSDSSDDLLVFLRSIFASRNLRLSRTLA